MSTRNQEKTQLKSLIKESIQELFADDTFINKIAKTITDKLEEKVKVLEDKIATMETKTAALERRMDFFQQNAKLNNICIYGIEERQNETLEITVRNIINSNSAVNLTDTEICASYRIGNADNNSQKPRPIIVKCMNFQQKMAILKSYKDKEKRTYVAEDLISTRRKLLHDAREKLGNKKVWSYRGSIFAKVNENKVKIQSNEDLQIL